MGLWAGLYINTIRQFISAEIDASISGPNEHVVH